MFDNIGGKIKTLAKVFFIIGVTASIVLAFIIPNVIPDETIAAIGLIVTIVFGGLASYLGAMGLYGFGQLIDNTDKLVTNQNTSMPSQSATPTVSQPASTTPATPANSLVIPAGTTSIAESKYLDRTDFKSVFIPDSVTSIGVCAFYGCKRLTSINYNGTKAQWKAITKGIAWNDCTGPYTVYCTDGIICKSDS